MLMALGDEAASKRHRREEAYMALYFKAIDGQFRLSICRSLPIHTMINQLRYNMIWAYRSGTASCWTNTWISRYRKRYYAAIKHPHWPASLSAYYARALRGLRPNRGRTPRRPHPPDARQCPYTPPQSRGGG